MNRGNKEHLVALGDAHEEDLPALALAPAQTPALGPRFVIGRKSNKSTLPAHGLGLYMDGNLKERVQA